MQKNTNVAVFLQLKLYSIYIVYSMVTAALKSNQGNINTTKSEHQKRTF